MLTRSKVLHNFNEALIIYNFCYVYHSVLNNILLTQAIGIWDLCLTYPDRPLLLVEIKPPSKFHWDSLGQPMFLQIGYYMLFLQLGRWWGCYAFRGQSGSWCGQPVMGITARSSLRAHSLELYWNGNITSDTSWAALEGIAQIIGNYVNS